MFLVPRRLLREMVHGRMDSPILLEQPVLPHRIHPLFEHRVQPFHQHIPLDVDPATPYPACPGYIRGIAYRRLDDPQQDHESAYHLPHHPVHHDLLLQPRLLLHGT